MNTYELTMIFGDKPSKDKVVKVVTEFVKTAKGELNKADSWGEKVLAYPIRKLKAGLYEHMVLTLPADKQPELDRTLRLEESLLRYLFVRV